ncbi:SlyX family protein [Iodobacter fluviatilis]|jgi:SlyX protein|uniref:SlyX protein n=1 Tax=Iodobacter fluviatilis TaxID=537 RepID=A0A7G3G8J2_9NEIS|nr:SlyX family protein [Iodobacter fluviatilis]QBC43459.1 SlyX protein [Iodobacter fluviatilis]
MNLEDRITELEIKLALQDELLESLNKIVATQQQQMDQVVNELRWLQQQEPSGSTQKSLFDEVPPHY